MLNVVKEKNYNLIEKLETLGFTDKCPNPWCCFDSDQIIVHASESCLERLKVTYENYIGTSLSQWWTQKYETPRSSEFVNREVRTATGQILIVKLKTHVIQFEAAIYTVVVAVDAKERFDYQGILNKFPTTENASDSIVDTLPMGISIVTQTGDILWVNKTYAAKLGYSVADLLFSKTIEQITEISMSTSIDKNDTEKNKNWHLKSYTHRTGSRVFAKIKTRRQNYLGFPVFVSIIDYLDFKLPVVLQEKIDTMLLGKKLSFEINATNLEQCAQVLSISIQELISFIDFAEKKQLIQFEGPNT